MAISTNAGEYRSKIGLDSVYVAEVTADSAAAYTAGTPEWLAPAAEASLEPNQSSTTQYADDQAYDNMYAEGETKITLTVTNIPIEVLAWITGREFDAASGRMYDNGGVPPYMALSFRSQKSNGAYRYYQFLKGTFEMPKEEAATKEAAASPKTIQLTYTAIKTIYKWNLGTVTDSVKRISGDTDTTSFSATGWFTGVQTPGYVAPSALALSVSVPTDGATNVVGTADHTLTFNNALQAAAIYGINEAKADGSVQAVVCTLDSTKKIMTVNPTGTLAAGTVYLLTYAVTDIYGQTLTGVINFTIAA